MAFIFIAGTGILAFVNLNRVVDNINKASNPDLKLLLLESLTSELSHAESSVKSYNLTRDKQYLEPYAKILDGVYGLMDSISHNASGDPKSRILADSLKGLVQHKNDVLEAILLLRNNELVTEELKRIDSKLSIADEANKKITKSKKLFVGKEERNRIKKEKEAAKPENVLARMKTEIGNELTGVKSDQLTQLKDIKYQEFALLKQDEEIMGRIRSLIFQLQEIEKQQIVKNTLESSELTAKTYKFITIFCLLGTLLMLVTIVVIINFIKKSKSYTAALQKANHEVEAFAKAKETFLYNVSHELRTPLNAVIGFSEQLENERDDHKRAEISQIIYKSARHLKHILNDILDFSKLNAGKFSLKNITFDPGQMARELELIVEKNASEKGLKSTFEITGTLPEKLEGDALRLRQVLLNIVDNAIKYTSEGSVNVTLKYEPLSDRQGNLHVKVADTGVGMTEEDLKKIFNAFEQASTRDQVNSQGTGLGLSITKELIELQGGELEVKSEVGKGTVFGFFIPYKSGEGDIEEVISDEQKADLGKNIEQARILVVDDVKVNLQLIEYILKKYNVQLTQLEDGHQVIPALAENHFDLVLLDMNLQEISGKQICRAIRNHEKEDVRSLPVIAVTAAHYTKDVLDEFGFSDILEKPFTEIQLLKVIHKYFAFDEDFGTETEELIFDENNPEHKPIIDQARTELKTYITQLENQAGSGNPENISLIFHKLIGVLHILGENELKDEAQIQEALWTQHPDGSLHQTKLQELISRLHLVKN